MGFAELLHFPFTIFALSPFSTQNSVSMLLH